MKKEGMDGHTHPQSHSHPNGEGHAHADKPHPHSTPSAEKETAPANRAWVIGIIILVILAVVGVLLYTKFSPGNETPTPTIQPVQVKLLVDQSCFYCPQTSTILAKMDESKVKYNLTTIDIDSDEGKALAKEFNITYAPTALLSVQGLDQNASIQLALQGEFIKNPPKTKNGWVIVPELFLDKQPKLLTFLQPPEACSIEAGTIPIIAQLDYGDCAPCIEAFQNLVKLQSIFPQVKVTYVPILYQRTTPKSINAALHANKGAVCADEMGFLNQYTECNYFNAQFHGSLDINFMKACIIDAGAHSKATQDAFISCVMDTNSPAEQELIHNTTTMHQWNPIKYTPSFVIDCKYSFVGQNSLAPYLCSIHPELEGCADLLKALHADQNQSTPNNSDLTIVSPDSNDTNATLSS